MRKVPFFSLELQSQKLKQSVMDAVSKIIDNTSYILGEETTRFEDSFAQYIGVNHSVGVSNGTAALYLGLKALELNEDDEVILPAATFTASAQAVAQLGAKPVFVDIDPHTWTINPASVEEAISAKTKLIMPVHLYGNPCAMDELVSLAKKYKLLIAEDAAQAHGARFKGRQVGSIGDMGCFSFYPSKNLGAMGDAGAVCFNDPGYEEKLKAYRNCGKDAAGAFEYLGFNYRMTNFQAAVLNIKLPFLAEWNERRRAIAQQYNTSIVNSKVSQQKVQEYNYAVYHLYVLKVDDRKRFCDHLDKHGVGFAFHYHSPLHLQKPYTYLNQKAGTLPNTEDLFARCVSIPLYPEMDQLAVDRVIEVVNMY